MSARFTLMGQEQSNASIGTSVLDSIGNTSLIKLSKVVPDGANIFLKTEWQNPTGSMKDRMALAMIGEAEKDGRLQPGGTVVEYTGGSTGTSLALVCTVKNYPLHIVTSDAFSPEKIKHMRKLGAHIEIIPSQGKGISKELIEKMMERAEEITTETEGYFTNQLHNVDQIKGYHGLGEEILHQTQHNVDAFVQSFGSSASIQGVAQILKRHDQDIRIVAVEPAESPVMSEGKSGSHDIEGIGAGFKPFIWDDDLVDDVFTVSTSNAKEMATRLAIEEGIFAGTSTGSNVVAAIELAKKMKRGSHIVTLAIDSGLKYLDHK